MIGIIQITLGLFIIASGIALTIISRAQAISLMKVILCMSIAKIILYAACGITLTALISIAFCALIAMTLSIALYLDSKRLISD